MRYLRLTGLRLRPRSH